MYRWSLPVNRYGKLDSKLYMWKGSWQFFLILLSFYSPKLISVFFIACQPVSQSERKIVRQIGLNELMQTFPIALTLSSSWGDVSQWWGGKKERERKKKFSNLRLSRLAGNWKKNGSGRKDGERKRNNTFSLDLATCELLCKEKPRLCPLETCVLCILPQEN